MSKRSNAFAGYLADIYTRYNQLSDAVALSGKLNFANGDIETLIITVMMEATRDSEEILLDIMAEMKAAMEVKQRLRDAIARLKNKLQAADENAHSKYEHGGKDKAVSCGRLDADLALQMLMRIAVRQSNNDALTLADDLIVTRERIRRAKASDDTNDTLDALNDLGEMETMQLQMLMDQKSQLERMISNIMKSNSDTQGILAQALKA